MLGPGLGYKTIFFILVPPHHLLVLSHAFTQHKVHPSQNGSTRMVTTALNVEQSRSDAFASFLDKNVSGLGPPPLSHTASNAMRIHLTTTKMTATYGKFVAGVLPLIMHTMTALPLTMDAS
jgi:hypothetical protein